MKFIIQEMWDYTTGMRFLNPPEFKKEMHATECGKFEGIDQWNYTVSLKVYSSPADRIDNVDYVGEMEPDQLFLELSKGGFGLLWYENKDGLRNLEYHTSISLARYLAAGIPVIVPAGIANQNLIKDNRLGFIVDSLDEAAGIVEAMNEYEYREYVRNVEGFAPALRRGCYTEHCLTAAIRAFYKKDACRISIPAKIYSLGNPVFQYAVLNISYEDALAISWSFEGKADGFLICDTYGRLVYETENTHQHYFLIKGYNAKSSFVVKAFVYTLKGKLVIAESASVFAGESSYIVPKVSLVIPAYNAQDSIIRSIDTALAQSFFDLEIIAVDDGSQDFTPNIIDWYAQKYSNIIALHQQNKGVAAARNAGIACANGEYIGFLDSDDMIHPDMVKELYCTAKENESDIVISSACLISNKGYDVFVRYALEEKKPVAMETFFFMHYIRECGYGVVVWNKLYRASLVKSRLFPVIPLEDEAWTPYILSYADVICYVAKDFYEYNRMTCENSLAEQLDSCSMEEKFSLYKNAVMFYLENGNPMRRKLLKELAMQRLSEKISVFAYGQYTELLNHIKVEF